MLPTVCVYVTDGSLLRWWHAVHRSADLCLRFPPLMRGVSSPSPPLCQAFTSLCCIYVSLFISMLRYDALKFNNNSHLHFCLLRFPPLLVFSPHCPTNSSINNNNKPLLCMHGVAADWWGWKNRRQINWIIRSMQMNSFQFKCRFWHFFCIRKEEDVREKEIGESFNQLNLYSYSNQIFVYCFKSILLNDKYNDYISKRQVAYWTTDQLDSHFHKYIKHGVISSTSVSKYLNKVNIIQRCVIN